MNNTQKIYQFSLVLRGVDETTVNLEDCIYAAGCDDALLSFRNGTAYLDFDRQAETFEQAVISAIQAVETADIAMTVVNVAPEDWVTESEIAKRLNVNRQTVSLWIKGQRRSQKHTFPRPVMKLTERSPVWKWHEIVEWLNQNHIIDNPTIAEQAHFIENLNAVLAERDPKVKKTRAALLKRLARE